MLDPFCGCGTTIEAAQKLKRPWIGIDVTYLAISLIKSRLQTAFGGAATYVMPNPSGINAHASLDVLVAHLAEVQRGATTPNIATESAAQ